MAHGKSLRHHTPHLRKNPTPLVPTAKLLSLPLVQQTRLHRGVETPSELAPPWRRILDPAVGEPVTHVQAFRS